MNIVLASRRKYMRKRTNPEGAPASVEDCIVSLVRDSFPYTGQPITPQVSVVTQDGVPLVVNLDYFVSYSDNVNVGAGVVIVTGTGEYVGSVTKTFQITSAAPQTGWQDFDLSKLGTSYATGTPNDGHESDAIYGCQTIDGDRIVYSRYGTNKNTQFVIGFDAGHEFDPSHFKTSVDFEYTPSTYESNGAFCISDDGLSMIEFSRNEYQLRGFAMSRPFDMSSTSGVKRSRGSVGSLCAFTSPDGTISICRRNVAEERYFKKFTMSNPWDVTSDSAISTITFIDEIDISAFCVSPDGKHIVVGYTSSGVKHLRKYDMSTPFDFGTCVQKSDCKVGNIYEGRFTSIFINSTGTKMLVTDSSSNKSQFKAYNLIA